MKKQTVKAAVIEFLGSFLITMVCCWSLYSIRAEQLTYLGHSLINAMILASLIWVAIVESGSHFNPIITIGIFFICCCYFPLCVDGVMVPG
jgi:glycerol uptake facilitator-like aquaporin